MRRLGRQGKRLLASLLAASMLAGMMPAATLAETPAPAQQETAQTEQGTAPSSGTAGDPNASPSPSQEPTPAPTPTPEVEPSPSPSGEPTPAPSPEPSQTPAAPQSPAKAPSQPASSSSSVTLEEGDVNTHIATYVNTVPEGITWAAGVTEATFDTAWETVTASAADGTEYTVEVVPEGTVYFVDSIAATGADGNKSLADIDSTAPYDAVKALVGDGLLNDTFDQYSPDANIWGLVDNGVRTKGFDSDADKYVTGIYGTGYTGTVEYRFPLEAGTYTITSGHHDWWNNQNRSMHAALTTIDGELLSLIHI